MLRKISFVLFIWTLAAGIPLAASETVVKTLGSPNKAVQGKVAIEKTISLDLDYLDRAVMRHATLGLELEEGEIGESLLEGVEERSIDEEWENRFGQNRVVRDRANEWTFLFVEKEEPKRKWGIVFRAFDNGFAFKYLLRQGPREDFALKAEKTVFRFADDLDCWATDNIRFNTSHENTFELTRLSQLSKTGLFGQPLVLKGDFGCAARSTKHFSSN